MARTHGQSGRFRAMLEACRQLLEGAETTGDALLDVGVLLLDYGFTSWAQDCFERLRRMAPEDLRPLVNLANLNRDIGNHGESRRLYRSLLERLPDEPIIRRNALVSLEYDPDASDTDRLAEARAWGAWAIRRYAGRLPDRPPLRSLAGRPMRVGYVSADMCQHTVGLFIKDVLRAHDPERVTAFVYSAGAVRDWVTDEIAAATQFRDVSSMPDAALSSLIREDEIDVLVDLSGHTAGSRLTVFALRPAPVQLSWLGYFATTGLPCMDGVLLDRWHAPPGTENAFVEPVWRLPMGRLCYQPLPWAPREVSALPCRSHGRVTFGCFNNTAKLNPDVIRVWAEILRALPESRLLLKWRTLNDEGFCDALRQSFSRQGVDPQCVELRGPSFHGDLLKEYGDVDVALDPFPFTGGLTSCEALWMGVPVVTWPQSRAVSRQTFALLSAIGLPELAARDAQDYVRIAVELASDRERLTALRAGMRERMRASPLMDVAAFIRQLEQCLLAVHEEIASREKVSSMTNRRVLHVGPGHRENSAQLPASFRQAEWREIRLDIDPAVQPDIVGSMLDMAAVEECSVDAVYSSHNIEHVYAHEVPVVLKEFLRVLKPEGFLVVTCPDLQTVAQRVAEDKLTEVAYQSPAGPITPLDIMYGWRAALARGNHFMAHKCGFTETVLSATLRQAGFATVATTRRPAAFDLWAVACKQAMSEAAIRELAARHLPQ